MRPRALRQCLADPGRQAYGADTPIGHRPCLRRPCLRRPCLADPGRQAYGADTPIGHRPCLRRPCLRRACLRRAVHGTVATAARGVATAVRGVATAARGHGVATAVRGVATGTAAHDHGVATVAHDDDVHKVILQGPALRYLCTVRMCTYVHFLLVSLRTVVLGWRACRLSDLCTFSLGKRSQNLSYAY
jgi:hypothetical protein